MWFGGLHTPYSIVLYCSTILPWTKFNTGTKHLEFTSMARKFTYTTDKSRQEQEEIVKHPCDVNASAMLVWGSLRLVPVIHSAYL